MVNRVIHKSYIMLVIMGFLIPVANVYADGDTTDFSITVNPSLNLRVSSSSVGFELMPSKNGTFDSASFNVYSSTNNSTGYTLTMSTNNVNLVSDTINPTTGTNPTISTLAETAEGISAAAFESSTSSDVLNHYGISIAGANYNAMKDEKEIKKTEENNVTEDTTAISLASKLNLLTVPGVYSTTINFQLVANPVAPAVPFIDPDLDPSKSTVHPCVKIGDLECEDTDDDDIPDSTVFPANSLLRTYEVAYANAGKPMYIEDANAEIGWRPMVDADLATIGGKEVRFAIQDISLTLNATPNSNNVCESAASSLADNSYMDTALVVDLRDGTSYNIIKASDNKCWLADNLALDPRAANTTLNSSNTNASTAAIENYLDGSTVAPQAGWSTYAVSYADSTNYYNRPRIFVYMKNVIAGSSSDPLNNLVTSDGWKVGVFYNICAASMGTYCYDSGQGVDKLDTAIDFENDICPAGWRLPTGGQISSSGNNAGGGEYQIIANSIQTKTEEEDIFYDSDPGYSIIRTALRLPLSGYYKSGSPTGPGSPGYFWSSTIYDGQGIYHLSAATTNVQIQNVSNRSDSGSVRCIAK